MGALESETLLLEIIVINSHNGRLELQITFIAMFLYFFFWNLINEGKEKLYNYKQKLMIGMPSVLYTLSFFMDTFSLSYVIIIIINKS